MNQPWIYMYSPSRSPLPPPSLFDPIDCILPGSSVRGLLQARITGVGLPCPPPGDLRNPGNEPVSLTSPALAGRFFTTSTIWEAQWSWDLNPNLSISTVSPVSQWCSCSSETSGHEPESESSCPQMEYQETSMVLILGKERSCCGDGGWHMLWGHWRRSRLGAQSLNFVNS